ncbi:hypothetical protein Salat_1680500 [Sesamum alatum]|uniref:Uncharacterized protein n=1 Tax=Sesamum alatum TaxID=300844 RepID=A0AAE1Y709_9LAMI|nr:hypothetical protein Salat_1680500 [Sesamum alatum]
MRWAGAFKTLLLKTLDDTITISPSRFPLGLLRVQEAEDSTLSVYTQLPFSLPLLLFPPRSPPLALRELFCVGIFPTAPPSLQSPGPFCPPTFPGPTIQNCLSVLVKRISGTGSFSASTLSSPLQNPKRKYRPPPWQWRKARECDWEKEDDGLPNFRDGAFEIEVGDRLRVGKNLVDDEFLDKYLD